MELRISGALYNKALNPEKTGFHTYLENDIVEPNDRCVIAMAGGDSWEQTSMMPLPAVVTAVYPIGELQVSFNRDPDSIGDTSLTYRLSDQIERADNMPIPRTAFLSKQYTQISGIIWSRRFIGDFFFQEHDFVLIHNAMARNQLPTNWAAWKAEYSLADDMQTLIKQGAL